MALTTLILLILLGAFFLAVFFWAGCDECALFLTAVCGFLCLFPLGHMSFGTYSTEVEKTEYSVESTSWEIWAITPQGKFSSRLKQDFDEWVGGAGYFEIHYNFWGNETRRDFHAKKPLEK